MKFLEVVTVMDIKKHQQTWSIYGFFDKNKIGNKCK